MTNDIYLSYNIMLMKTIGMLSFGSENRIKIWLVWFWRLLQNLVLLYFTIAAYINLKQSTGFLLEVQGIMYVGTGLFYTWRLNYFILYETELLHIVNEMQILFKWKTNTGIEEKCLEKQVKFVKRFTMFCVIVLTIISHSTIILPFLLKRIFAFPLWFPDVLKSPPYYVLTLCYQLYVMQVFVIMTMGIYLFFASAIILTCFQLDMLGWECKCLIHKASNKLEKQLITEEVKGPNNETLNSQQIETEQLRELSKLIAFHQSLISFCDRFNDFFSTMLLCEMLSILSVVVFVISIIIKRHDLIFIAAFGPYIVTGTTYVFLPCYFGHLLTTQSEQLFEDLYDSPWYMCSEKFKIIFKLLQLRARKPIFLTIGKFGNLSLGVFLWCVRSIVSYVTVLRQVSEQH